MSRKLLIPNLPMCIVGMLTASALALGIVAAAEIDPVQEAWYQKYKNQRTYRSLTRCC